MKEKLKLEEEEDLIYPSPLFDKYTPPPSDPLARKEKKVNRWDVCFKKRSVNINFKKIGKKKNWERRAGQIHMTC